MFETTFHTDFSINERLSDHGIRFAANAPRAIVRLEWRDNGGAGFCPGPIGRATRHETFTFLRTGPTAGLAISRIQSAETLIALLSEHWDALDAVSVDISHGYAALEIAGRNAASFLAAAVPVDIEALAIDSVRRSVIQEHGVLIHRTAEDQFELYVDRSLAASLWERLEKRALNLLTFPITPEMRGAPVDIPLD